MGTRILRCHIYIHIYIYIYKYLQNGVKQVGVLSAMLFCIYMDELISRLEHSGIGCYIDNKYYGNISYTHDLKLLCPSINGLQKMLDICNVFFFWKNILWNIMLARLLPFAMVNPAEGPSDLHALSESEYAGKHLWNIWGMSIVLLWPTMTISNTKGAYT